MSTPISASTSAGQLDGAGSQTPFMDPNLLTPDDASFVQSFPSRQWNGSANVDGPAMSESARRRRRSKDQRSRSRKRTQWRKLLWVKQSYPDNYTDPHMFLSALQRPRLQPYDFWPLFADSTVIVQHVCSVAIFVSCFVGIYQEHVSPVSVVSWASAAAVLGWVLWDMWTGQEQERVLQENVYQSNTEEGAGEDAASVASGLSSSVSQSTGLGLSTSGSGAPYRSHSRNRSSTSLNSAPSGVSPAIGNSTSSGANYAAYAPYNAPPPLLSPRNQQRLATAKSALLIYGALLGLSPILKSLTKSTTSDSIWAMSTWLMFINVFFFDYSGGLGAKFPALSTNAALMASTVLASRLPSATHVFSLTLFSIEVFGLFPVFRVLLRHRSWELHVLLTILLIVGAGAGLGIILIGGGVWKSSIIGVIVWGLGNVLAMGACSWWLIGLQRYKNVVTGPWDPARPIIRAGGWE